MRSCLCVLLVGIGCSRKPELARQSWDTMGTYATITAPGKDRARLAPYANTAMAVFQDVDDAMSLFKPDSELSRLNRAAGTGAVTLSAPTLAVLQHALSYAEVSGGCFDPTVGPLMLLWGFHGGIKPDKPIEEDRIQSVKQIVGYRHIIVSNDTGTVRLDKPGMVLDLGGVAKGYAVDVAYERLRALGAKDLMVDLGGNIRCGGSPRGKEPWIVGVRNPFDRREIVGTLRLTNGMAVATSGNYERFVTINGKRYAHIMDPRAGRPVTGMAAVTVVAREAVHADGVSSMLFVLGIEAAKPVLGLLKDREAMFIPDEQPMRIVITPGLKECFTPGAPWKDCVSVMEIPGP